MWSVRYPCVHEGWENLAVYWIGVNFDLDNSFFAFMKSSSRLVSLWLLSLRAAGEWNRSDTNKSDDDRPEPALKGLERRVDDDEIADERKGVASPTRASELVNWLDILSVRCDDVDDVNCSPLCNVAWYMSKLRYDDNSVMTLLYWSSTIDNCVCNK